MDEAQPQSLDGRLGKLEGLMIGLQASITQSQSTVASYIARMEAAEKRLLELERGMITKSDLKELLDKVDKIAGKQQSADGGIAVAKFSVPNILSLAAILVALLTFIYSNDNQFSDPPSYRQTLPKN